MKNFAFHSLLRRKMIVLLNSYCITCIFLYKRLGECTLYGTERVSRVSPCWFALKVIAKRVFVFSNGSTGCSLARLVRNKPAKRGSRMQIDRRAADSNKSAVGSMCFHCGRIPDGGGTAVRFSANGALRRRWDVPLRITQARAPIRVRKTLTIIGKECSTEISSSKHALDWFIVFLTFLKSEYR